MRTFDASFSPELSMMERRLLSVLILAIILATLVRPETLQSILSTRRNPTSRESSG